MADNAEEQEIVDPLPQIREHCADSHCQNYKEKLETCNERVTGRSQTEESCHEEMIDFYHCVDHCAMPKLFKKLK